MPMSLFVLEETTIAIVACLIIVEIAILFISAIYRVTAIEVEMPLADGEEQEPVEIIQLLVTGLRLMSGNSSDIGSVQKKRAGQ